MVKKFQLRLPELLVHVIEKDNLKDMRNLIRSHPEFFPQLDAYIASIMKVKSSELRYDPYPDGYQGETFAKPGDYLVVSENGCRFVTDDPAVMEGDFRKVAWQLKVPASGTDITD